MNNQVTYNEVVARLEENGLNYETISWDGLKIIIMERGGRIIGPFEEERESILWLNRAFKSRDDFKKFLTENDWNLGAERLWIAPELPFFTRKRARFDDTYTVQPEIDPGSYQLARDNACIKLDQTVDVPVYEMDFMRKRFRVERHISKANDPLTYVDGAKEMEYRYCGYTHDVFLSDLSPNNVMPLEPWILTQVNPGGRILTPYFGEFEFVDYYEPIDDTYQKVKAGYVDLKVTGDRKYKVGYKSATTIGRAAYINRMGDDEFCLIIKNYFNDPSNPYSCDPWHSPGSKGCSLFVYNDSGENGGFAEFENCGLTLEDGQQQSTRFTQWFFIADKRSAERIIEILLGIVYPVNL